jgi:hypothetical protein
MKKASSAGGWTWRSIGQWRSTLVSAPASEDADCKRAWCRRGKKLTAPQIEALEAEIAARKEEKIAAIGEDFKIGLDHADCQKRFEISRPQHGAFNESV